MSLSSMIQLTGGMLRTGMNNGVNIRAKFIGTNIHFCRTDVWKNALVKVNNIPVSTIESNTNNWIELNVLDNTPSLLINDIIVWQQKNIFNYNVTLHLNNKFPTTPYNMIFKYYWKPLIISPPL